MASNLMDMKMVHSDSGFIMQSHNGNEIVKMTQMLVKETHHQDVSAREVKRMINPGMVAMWAVGSADVAAGHAAGVGDGSRIVSGKLSGSVHGSRCPWALSRSRLRHAGNRLHPRNDQPLRARRRTMRPSGHASHGP